MRDHFDVSEMSDDTLRHSLTWMKYQNACGTCSLCKEWTDVLSPCCGRLVFFEGAFYDADNLWSQIQAELEQCFEPDVDAEIKEGGLTQDEVDFLFEKLKKEQPSGPV